MLRENHGVSVELREIHFTQNFSENRIHNLRNEISLKMGQSCPGGLYDRSNDDVICATVYIEYLYNE